MLQIITATGARPEALALCHHWMRAQTYTGQVLWLIVDDGPAPSPIEKMPDNWRTVVIRPAPFWQPGQNTQARNLLRGIDALDRKYPVVCFEDDDHYAPDWLDTVVRELDKAELVGERMARYYNIATRTGRQLNNQQHASLCATAMRGSAIDSFHRACRANEKFIDLTLWRSHKSKHLFGGHRVTGIKGLPGRGGIGMGHKKDFQGQRDPDGSLLRSWIGEDAERYL